jgi:putative PIN family toxin of toxin-antitoxin system
MEETLRVLREKFHWPEDALREVEVSISEFTERVKPAQVVDVIKEDPADNRILECAAAAKSDFIVTGDQHLLRLGSYGNIRITKVADFLDLVATAY